MPSSPSVPSSHLRKICRCTVFVTIFLLVSDSRLRPTFLATFQDGKDPSIAADRKGNIPDPESAVQSRAIDGPGQFYASPLLARLRRAVKPPEDEDNENDEGKNEDNPEGEDGGEKGEEDENQKDADGGDESGKEEGEADKKDPESGEDEDPASEEPSETPPPKTRHKGSKAPKPAPTHSTRTPATESTTQESTTEDQKDDETTDVATEKNEEDLVFNCTIPAIRQFPKDIFSQTSRRYGGMIVHLLVVVYMFLCLAVVCDDYFCGSLELVCKRLNLSEDVAGATLMAAGSSAPELFISLIGVFVAKGDVGTGTIVGSAVFNILFVVGTCAFFGSRDGTQVSWWPVCRDTLFYALSILILIGAIADGEVTWYESLIMLFFYGLYVSAMRYNTRLYEWTAMKTGWTGPVDGVGETARLAGGGRFDKPVYSGYEQFTEETDDYAPAVPQKGGAMTLPADERIRRNPRKLTFANAALKIMMSPRYFYPKTRFVAACRFVIAENQVYAHEKRRGRMGASFGNNNYKDSADSDYGTTGTGSRMETMRKFHASFEAVHDQFEKWRERPAPTAGYPAFIRWIAMYPVYFVLYYTIPDAKKERWAKWYWATFFASISWIAFFSYIMVWMVTVIGHTISIPDSIMGITFLAAGTSIPDAMASLIVAKQGMIDMAVSNSIGSNVFDILIGLALPWFIATVMYKPGSTVRINSNGLVFNACLLFITVAVAVGGLKSTGWKLTRKIGMMFFVTYAIYLILAVMIEYNVFGHVNPRMCDDAEANSLEAILAKKG